MHYRQEDVAGRVAELTEGRSVDRIIEVDFGANSALDFSIVAANGDIVVYGSGAPDGVVSFGPAIMKNVTVHFFVVYNLPSMDRARAETELTRLLASNALQHNIAARYTLDDIIAAHDAVEFGRVNGNIVVSLHNE